MDTHAAAKMKPTKSVEKNLAEAEASESSIMSSAVSFATDKFDMVRGRVTTFAKAATQKTTEIASDKGVQVSTAAAAGGAVAVGTAGAGMGLVVGGVVGTVVGVVPAVFTFGLSIPVGAAIGGGCGASLGGAVGGGAGAVGAGAAGYGAYKKRSEISDFLAMTKKKVLEKVAWVKTSVAARTQVARTKGNDFLAKVKAYGLSTKKKMATRYGTLHQQAVEKASAAKVKATEIASDKAVQVTTASAAGGAVVVGAGGAATGLAVGTVTGAAVGVLPALFTFGLSIPLFAVIGGGCGTAVGTAAGAATGFVGGGTVGYGAYAKREVISTSVNQTISKVDGAAKYVKETASHSADYVRARIVGGTGGTAE